MPNKSKKKSKPRSLFRRKYDFSGGLCCYCLKSVPYSQITRDHIIPRSRGGALTIENVAPSCFTCNQRKADQLGWIPKIDYTEFEKQLESERAYIKRRIEQIHGQQSHQLVVERQISHQL